MQRIKLLLYAGLVFIVAGLILRFLMNGSGLGNVLVSVGGSLKLVYVFLIMKFGGYKPGIELLYLGLGVTIVIVGSWLRKNMYDTFLALSFTVSGVVLKAFFVYVFIRKMRAIRVAARQGKRDSMD